MKKNDKGFLSERSRIKQAGNGGWERPIGQGGDTETGKSTPGGRPSKCKGPGIKVSILGRTSMEVVKKARPGCLPTSK